jgi:uncharacterized protein (DUF58 family)
LQLNASRYLPGASIGQRPSLRRLPSSDFLDHRMYIPGDDIRFIDWKASARHEHTFIKQGNLPKEITVYILLDCSVSMGWGNSQKSFCMLQIAMVIAYLALNHSETLFIVPLGKGKISSLGPIHGKGQIPAVINYLKQIPIEGQSDLKEDVINFRKKIAKQGGIVYILSDLLYLTKMDEVLEKFRVPSWDVVLLHILHPEELNPTISGNFEFQDVETGNRANYDINQDAKMKYLQHLTDWMSQVEVTCVEHNHFYSMIPSDWDLETRIIPHLRAVDLVVPV